MDKLVQLQKSDKKVSDFTKDFKDGDRVRVIVELTKAGVEVLWDDRAERPGVKFKDADLIGIPVRITVGKLAPEGKVEYKLRRDADKAEMTVDEAIKTADEGGETAGGAEGEALVSLCMTCQQMRQEGTERRE